MFIQSFQQFLATLAQTLFEQYLYSSFPCSCTKSPFIKCPPCLDCWVVNAAVAELLESCRVPSNYRCTLLGIENSPTGICWRTQMFLPTALGYVGFQHGELNSLWYIYILYVLTLMLLLDDLANTKYAKNLKNDKPCHMVPTHLSVLS